jgi:DNA-binding transcriptional MerR regulator
VISIGELAREVGCKVQTIRWYEEVGLLPPPARTEGGHRLYGRGLASRLAFVRHAREFGFPIEAIRTLLDLADHPERPCAEAHAVAGAQLAEVEEKLRRLAALRSELVRMTSFGCGNAAASGCQILEVLADSTHAHCGNPGHAWAGSDVGISAAGATTAPEPRRSAGARA